MSRFLREFWILPATLAFAPTFRHLWSRWTEVGSYYTHGPWTLAFAALSLVVVGLRKVGTSEGEARAGRRTLIAALLLQGLGLWLGVNAIQYLAVIGGLLGAALQWRGRWIVSSQPWMWGLVLLSFPLPSFFTVEIAYRLRVASSEAAVVLIRLIGSKAQLIGNNLLFRFWSEQDLQVTVGEACSGLKTWIAMLVLACALAAWERGRLRQLWLIVAALPAALLGNTLRIALICALMDRGAGAWALGAGHATIGVVTFLIAFGILAWGARLWPKGDLAIVSLSGARSNTPTTFSAGMAILSIAVLAVSLRAQSLPETHREAFDPTELSEAPQGWVSTEMPLDESTFEILGTREARMMQFTDPTIENSLYVLVVEARSESTAAHPPEICLEADGWDLQNSQLENPAPGTEFMASVYTRVDSPAKLLVRHWYEMDGRRTPRFMTYQMWHWRSLLLPGPRLPGRLIRLSVRIEAGARPEDAITLMDRYLEHLPTAASGRILGP